MPDEHEKEAQARRAKELREQIAKVIKHDEPPSPPKNPRDAIHDKMRELDGKRNKSSED